MGVGVVLVEEARVVRREGSHSGPLVHRRTHGAPLKAPLSRPSQRPFSSPHAIFLTSASSPFPVFFQLLSVFLATSNRRNDHCVADEAGKNVLGIVFPKL